VTTWYVVVRPVAEHLGELQIGLTIVRPNLRSVPEPPTLDPPSISKHDVRLLWRFLTSSDLDLGPFHLKTGTPLTRGSGNVNTSFDFSTFIFSELRADTGQMDKQTEKRIMQPTRWPHNNNSNSNRHDNIDAAITMAQLLREFTQFTWWIQNSARWLLTFGPSQLAWAAGPPIGSYSVYIHQHHLWVL